MATASSAQREPSMEEILASIRRIIEDSDTGRKQPAEAGELRQDLEPAAVAAPTVEVDAFRSELHADTGPRKPATLAEVQAQLAAADPAIARVEARPEPVRAAPAAVDPEGAEPSAQTATSRPAAANAPQTAETIVADWRREIAAVGGSTVTAKPAVRAPEAAPRVEIEREEPALEAAAHAGAPRASEPEAQPARPAILSEHTGRQVAAAFGELSDAFASRGKKSFDEMAEEMLRPMLQDWLDNNLPTLVERLVREEIERVARGAQ
ncbi:PopZ family protein [Mesorhizobium humile]|uniref:PopZ family protein n=1 Tax=Mesorhizobium humile TaxID=3072313 RepID=A0ABU4YC89_9HYPH|nr:MULTISPECIES: PopZ family protein [unclassified Mesorhizobium]MDX8459847.1 PopZ family protein [Mesorhizobium sp. VK2D]MDX8484557.1 PopZ family protein [Mesorhizobium sp. VK2B]